MATNDTKAKDMDSSCTIPTENSDVPQLQPIATPGLQIHEPNVVPQSPMATLFPMSTCSMFMSGYADCAKEAIRFLIEEEGLPYSHPLVVGLYQHLSEHEKLLHIQQLLKSANLYEESEMEDEFTDDQNEADDDRSSSGDAEEVCESDNAGKDPGPTLPGGTDKLVQDIAKQIFRMMQDDDYSDDDDTSDEGFAE